MNIMTTTERLLSAAHDIWSAYHKHPFIQGIADGTLDRARFQYYMIQDYLYLIDYAKVFALGVAKAQDEVTMRLFAAYVHQILDVEMEIHRNYMQRLGISPQAVTQTPVALDNLSYTAYMLKIAYEEGAAEIAAAILSCAVSYEQIAQTIVTANPEAIQHPFYGEWISGYANEAYSRANQDLIRLTERLTAGFPEDRMRKLEEIFLCCSRYELAFWDMAWEQKR